MPINIKTKIRLYFIFIITCGLFTLSIIQVLNTAPDPALLYKSISPIPLFLAAILIIAYITLNTVCASVVLALSAVAILFISAKFNLYGLNLSIMGLVALFAILYFTHDRCCRTLALNDANKERLREEVNGLKNDIALQRSDNDYMKKKTDRIINLKSIIETLSSTLTLNEVCPKILSEASRIITKSDSYILYIVDTKRQKLSLADSLQRCSGGPIKAKAGDIFDNWVLKFRKPLLVEDARNDFRFNMDNLDNNESRRIGSLISIGLFIENRVIGILRLDSQAVNNYTQDDLRLLSIIGNLSSIAIENAQLYARTQELAIRDDLTGLFVRRYFIERLDAELARALRSDAKFSLLMMDIDFFKTYNDTFGHSAGDIVLRRISKILEAHVKEAGDLVARYGGEEFIALLINKDKAEAAKCAESIRESIEKEVFILRRQPSHVAISIGAASFPQDAKVAHDIIKMADTALLAAKKTGRNKVCSAKSGIIIC